VRSKQLFLLETSGALVKKLQRSKPVKTVAAKAKESPHSNSLKEISLKKYIFSLGN